MEYVLCAILSVIAVCLIVIVYLFAKLPKKAKSDVTADTILAEKSPEATERIKVAVLKPCAVPDDVVFDGRNLPARINRSRKKKVNYGKDFNAYLVKGGTLYHKRSCTKLKGKRVTTKHIYECIADKNKRPCPMCNPRTEIHDWYKAKFPESKYVKAIEQGIQTEQLSVPESLEPLKSEVPK